MSFHRLALGSGLSAGALLLAIVGFAVSGAVAAPRTGFDPEQLFSEGNDWEPHAAVDPSSSFVYMVTTGRDAKECPQCPEPSILVRVSPDGGASWGPVDFVCGIECRTNDVGSAWQADPVVRVADDGTVFVVWLNGWNPGPVVSKSTDHGQTWSVPVIAGQTAAGWADKPWLAVSPDGQDVFVAFNQGDPFVVASHDGGATFGRPVKVTPPTNQRYWYPEGGVVTSDGVAYFSMSVENPFGDGPVELVVLKSADGGAAWSVISIDRSEESPRCPLDSCLVDEYQAQIVIDADSAGVLMVAYMKTTVAGEPKRFFSRVSSDGGDTWSEPSLVNDRGDSNFPAIAHGPGPGDFRIAWQDDRNGPSAWNTWYKRTTDYGRRWSREVRLSDLGDGAPYKSADGYLFPYGDYFGIAADAHGVTFVIWGEGTGRGTGGGSWFTKGQ